MGKYRTLQTTFNSGEFDKSLRSRDDIKTYFQGALRMKNYSLLSHGGFIRRYGSVLGPSVPSTARLIPFEYSSSDALLLVVKPTGFVDVRALDGSLVASLSGGEWAESEIFEITYEQRGNVTFLAHRNWQTKIIRRVSGTEFTLEKYEFYQSPSTGKKMQPYSNTNQDKKFQVSVASLAVGSTTITSNIDMFSADWVGTWMQISDNGYGEITAYIDEKNVTYDQKSPPSRELLTDPVQTNKGKSKVRITMVEHGFSVGDTIKLDGFLSVSGFDDDLLNAEHVITNVVSENIFKIDLVSVTADESTIGGGLDCAIWFYGETPDYKVQSFSNLMGWPGAVALHQERLFFAGTIEEPDSIFSTRVSELDVFDLGDGFPADSIQVTLDAGRVNQVRHLVSSRHLQVFTNDAEFYVPTPESENVTPENFTIRKQTPYGSSYVRASGFDGATIFFQDSGRAVREFLYTDREYAYNARNIALMAQQLIRQPKDVAVIYGSSVRPEKYMFVVNGDGSMAVMHMIREEEMLGWAEWETDGLYKSVCVVGQRVFTIVNRSGGAYLEEFDQELSLTLDGQVGFEDTDGGVWGPVPEYAGMEVAVMQNGFFEGYVDVDMDGYFSEPVGSSWSNVSVGLNFPCEAETMPVSVSLPDGSLVGLPLRLTRCVIDCDDTMSLLIDGQRLDIRETQNTWATPSGTVVDERVEFNLDTVSRAPTVHISQEAPLACAVYSLMVEVSW